MNIQDLYIYPVKSLGGIRLEKAQALQKGFEMDRRWMLTGLDGQCITQRTEHQLALLQSEVTEEGIKVSHKKHPGQQIIIPFNRPFTESLEVSVWDDTILAGTINEEINQWFSEYLEKPCRLVYQHETGARPVDIRYAENNEQVSFADAFPYLLISQASLDDLNSRLARPVPMDRFRPNIVLSGTVPFEEDTWAEIQIGTVRFKVAKPCSRCVLTTVDQETAVMCKEPLYTLSKYRTMNNKVMFGQNLIALNPGTISEGDSVEVVSLKTLPNI